MKAAIMGYGTIGSGVYEVLDKNCKSVEKKAGEPIEVKYILDLREFPGSPVEKLVIHDVEQIVNDPEIGVKEILVEWAQGAGTCLWRVLLHEYYSLMHIAEEWVEWEYLEIFPASQDL